MTRRAVDRRDHRRGPHRRASAVLAGVLGLPAVLGLVGCSDDGPDLASFCAAVEVAPDLQSVFMGFSNRSLAELGADLSQAEASYERIRDLAPGDVSSETDEIVDVVMAIIAAVRDNPDDPNAAARFIQRTTDDRPTLGASTAAFSRYVTDNCDLELDPAEEIPAVPTTESN